MKYSLSLYIFVLTLIFSGCAPKTQITLLPEDDGKVGIISIADNKKETHTIDKAYTSLNISEKGDIEKKAEIEKDVLSKYSEVLNALPKKGQSHLFFFPNDSADLNPEQILELRNFTLLIKNNDIIEIICIGHSDSLGDKEYNKILSLKRAQSVANVLTRNFVDKSIIKLEYYGDANPLVKTEGNKSSPQNRRVEIILK